MMFQGKKIQAIKYTGDLDILENFCPNAYSITHRAQVYLHTEGRLYPSNYIVRLNCGRFKIFEESLFEALFDDC